MLELRTIEFAALAATSSPDLSSMVSVMSVRMRPKDDALVISRVHAVGVVIVHRYSACVWADTMTLMAGSSRVAISAMSLPARFPAQPFRLAVPDWNPPWWITSTLVFTPMPLSCSTARLAARPHPRR